MGITAEQRAELERRGWRYYPNYGDGAPKWFKNDGKLYCECWTDDHRISGDFALAVEIAAILGIAHPGYRLVPESVLRNAVKELTDSGSSNGTGMTLIAEGIATVHEAARLRSIRRYEEARDLLDRADDHFDDGTERLAELRSTLADALRPTKEEKKV